MWTDLARRIPHTFCTRFGPVFEIVWAPFLRVELLIPFAFRAVYHLCRIPRRFCALRAATF